MAVNVFISDLRFSSADILKTTLGSCVSVMLFADLNKSKNPLSSMSHYLLPEPTDAYDIKKQPFRFGTIILKHQIEEMQRQGLPIRSLKAKIAGGSNMFPARANAVINDIGQANIQVARKVLHEFDIEILAENTGGSIGRNIEFDPQNKKLKVTIFGQETLVI